MISLADNQVIADARRIVGEPEDSVYVPIDAHEFCSRIFHTCYMGTENSSKETRKRAKDLAEAIGRSVAAEIAISLSDSSLMCTAIIPISIWMPLSHLYETYSASSLVSSLPIKSTAVVKQRIWHCRIFRCAGDCFKTVVVLKHNSVAQARLRMLLAYFFAQLLPWVRGRTGALLVLGSANVDERYVRPSIARPLLNLG